MCVLLWVQTESVRGALHQPPRLLTAVGDLTFHTGETEKPLATSASLRDKAFLFQSSISVQVFYKELAVHFAILNGNNLFVLSDFSSFYWDLRAKPSPTTRSAEPSPL